MPNLASSEAALTGESLPIEKKTDPVVVPSGGHGGREMVDVFTRQFWNDYQKRIIRYNIGCYTTTIRVIFFISRYY